MTFEDEKLSQAMKALQETEKRCENTQGFMKSIKKKLKKGKKEVQKKPFNEIRMCYKKIVIE